MSPAPPIRVRQRGFCPRCGTQYVKYPVTSPRRQSDDHILPQGRGGRYAIMYGDVRNIEVMCAGCNGFRAACGDCWAVVACIDAVARSADQTREDIYKAWKVGIYTEITKKLNAAVKARVRSVPPTGEATTHDDGRLARSRCAVKIGMVVHHLGIDEFVWPADTAAKRVWNLATLAKGGYAGPEPSQ